MVPNIACMALSKKSSKNRKASLKIELPAYKDSIENDKDQHA